MAHYAQNMFNGSQPWDYTSHHPSNPGGYANNQSSYGSRSAPRANGRNSAGRSRGSFNQLQSFKNKPPQLWCPDSSITSPQPKFSRVDYNGINGYPSNDFQPMYNNYFHGFNGKNYQQPPFSYESSYTGMRGIPRGHNQVTRGRGSRNVPKPNEESAGTYRSRKQSNRHTGGNHELSATQLKILEILNKQPECIAEFKVIRIEMMRVDGLEKKDLNHAIYDMKSRGLVKRIQDTPPIWQATAGNNLFYSAASSEPSSFYNNDNVIRTNVNIVDNSSNNYTTEPFVSDTYNEGQALNNFCGIESENLGDPSIINMHPTYRPNSKCSTFQSSHPCLEPTVQGGHQSFRPGLGRGRAMSLFKTSINDWVGAYDSNHVLAKCRADGQPECNQSADIEQNNCITKRLQDLSELPVSRYDTEDRFQRNSQQPLTDKSQFDNTVEDFMCEGNLSSDITESVIGSDHIKNSSLPYNARVANSTTVIVSSHSVTVVASSAQDVPRLTSSVASGSQSSGGFKVPLPPKQLLLVDPKFQSAQKIVHNIDHSNTKLNINLSLDTNNYLDTTPSIAFRETSCEPTYSFPRSSDTCNEYHSLPASFGSLNVEESINWDGVPAPSSGLQRCMSLQDGSRKKSNNPFALALQLDDEDEDDDISNNASSSNIESYSREAGSNTLPRSMSFDQITPMSYAGSSIMSAPYSGRSASCSSTDSWNQRGSILTSLVGFGGPEGSSGQSITGESFAALNKNCISALMEYAQARKMEATIECIDSHGPSHKPKFKMAVFMGGRWFPYIECTNKKEGKKEAADVALRTLMSEGSYQSSQTTALPFESLGQKATHFDRIASLAHQTFNRLAATVMESMVGKKVLGAFIMTTGPNDPGTVISIGTGNRCITGTFLSLEGQTVNDSHAEVISRRGLIRFLYRQLLSYTPGDSSTIFELSPTGKLKVKDGIKFHLYISTAPCGDGALFSPRDIGPVTCPETGGHTPTFANKLQGKLRTKMEGGEGTIPIDDQGGAQCWDGILRGERLRTMSCSDKVCRWNIVGLQGALLSHFIEPVYMASLTLGFLYDHGHLSRAVCCRLSNGEPDISSKLPQGYRINHPLLGRVTAYDPTREVQKTKELSVNWVHGDTTVELTDGTKGICVSAAKNGQTSQVAKCSLFEQYHRACQRFNRTDLLQYHTYRHAKHQALEFRAVNQLMCEKFRKLGHGRWVTKPVEEEMFSWNNAV